MTEQELLEVMKLSIINRDWQGYLSFRRQLIALNPKFQSKMREFYGALSDADLIAYADYFGFDQKLPTHIKEYLKIKEKAKQEERERLAQERVTALETKFKSLKPILRKPSKDENL
ncbi:hypothetical protein [Scytonema sp. NUACC26]|uniref:hypothetical protein n=1 Tax=Scytonema sp. NUACC26 TaxID=3140176 RepID=UPI0034DCAB5C